MLKFMLRHAYPNNESFTHADADKLNYGNDTLKFMIRHAYPHYASFLCSVSFARAYFFPSVQRRDKDPH